MPKIVLPVTKEEYEAAGTGSKFVTFPPNAKIGDVLAKPIELGMPDWDTQGKSIKFPVTVISEDDDSGKEDKLSCGVLANSVWKFKQTYKAITDEDLEFDRQGRPVFDTDLVAGKQAKGIWTLQENTGGKSNTPYPKLTSIVSADTRVAETPF